MNKLYKVEWATTDYDYGYQMDEVTFCGIFDSKEEAEKYAKEIEQSETYDLISGGCTFSEVWVQEIELNKRYWKE